MRVPGSDPDFAVVCVNPHQRRHARRALASGIRKPVVVFEPQGDGFDVVNSHWQSTGPSQLSQFFGRITESIRPDAKLVHQRQIQALSCPAPCDRLPEWSPACEQYKPAARRRIR